jgi:hypothetical protein
MEMDLTLAETVVDWVIKALPHDTSDAAVVTALRNKHPGELLALFFNWQGRLISSEPRKLMRSTQFDQNTVAAERSGAVLQIIDAIEQGNDLSRYLSRRVRSGFVLPDKPNKKNLRRLQHLDMLLNEWGIHHLHLSTNVEIDGFVERGGPLLFVMFRADRAYLLDIGTHETFEDDKLAQIAISNWPNDQLFLEIKGIIGLSGGTSHTSEDRKKLRSAGISSFIQFGNRVFSPAGGISTAGTSVQASMRSNRIMRALEIFEEHVLADPSPIIAFIRKHGGMPADPPEFEFSLFQNGFGVIEKTSGVPIGLQG